MTSTPDFKGEYNAAPYLGIPFVDHGRDEKGCDCWGLNRLIYAREAGINLPDYADISVAELLKVARAIESDCATDIWKKVDRKDLCALDVVVMTSSNRTSGPAVHVGTMVTGETFIHTAAKISSHLSTLSNQFIAPRIRGFFRHHLLEGSHG